MSRFSPEIQDSRTQRTPVVRLDSPLMAGETTGGSSARIGRESATKGAPSPTLQTVGAIPYLLDLIPQNEGDRVCSLEANDSKSCAMTLIASYQEIGNSEIVPEATLQVEENTTYFSREHVIYTQFGVAGTSSIVAWDCVEGNTISVPSSTATCTIVDYGWSRSGGWVDNTTLRGFKSQVAASLWPIATKGTLTVRVFTPYQVTVDLAAPPTFAGLRESLLRALVERSIVTVA